MRTGRRTLIRVHPRESAAKFACWGLPAFLTFGLPTLAVRAVEISDDAVANLPV
jgi:hypothetical protein